MAQFITVNPHHLLKLAFSMAILYTFSLLGDNRTAAQGTGNLAEMDRLEQRADELAAQADPEGAAQTIGKAAMMADILMLPTQEPSTQAVFQAASMQYRAQERGLRALALFERAGGHPPAPAGVCHYLSQALTKLQESQTFLEQVVESSDEEIKSRRDKLVQGNQEWKTIFEGLQEDFECPTNASE
jgi:hypothetical protein